MEELVRQAVDARGRDASPQNGPPDVGGGRQAILQAAAATLAVGAKERVGGSRPGPPSSPNGLARAPKNVKRLASVLGERTVRLLDLPDGRL
eukprot:2227279-Alexandrium_andersonii.AAC.1